MGEERTLIFDKTNRADTSIPSSLVVTLRIINGKQSGKEFRINSPAVVLGRGDDVDFKLEDASMSRKHCVVTYKNMEFRIKDLNSTNGTYLNGSEVKEYALRTGDKVIVGETMLQFNIERLVTND